MGVTFGSRRRERGGSESDSGDGTGRAGRRGFLRLAAGAAAGGTAVALAGADQAAAATGGPLLMGQSNSPTAVADVTRLDSPSASALMPVALLVRNFTGIAAIPSPEHRTAIFATSSDADASAGYRIGIHGNAEPFGDPNKEGVGVCGSASAGVYSVPSLPTGVFGRAGQLGQGGTGVAGEGETYGVTGNGFGPTGIGVRARSDNGIGLVATGAGNAVNATSTGATGLNALGTTGVSGTAYSTGDGVSGTSTSGRGVLATSASGDGVRGVSTSGRAVVARSTSNIAVSAESQTGLDLDCNGTGRVRVKPQAATGAPTAGTYAAGELVLDAAGDLYACVVAGAPGTWHKVGATAAITPTGLFRPVDPFRAYDSREAAYPVNGPIAAGASRVVPIQDAHSSSGAVTAANVVPPGAIAVTFNLTVVFPTSAAGFLAIAPGDATEVAVSTLNWTAPNVAIANGGTTKIDASRQVKVFVGGLPGTAHVLVDITGYYA